MRSERDSFINLTGGFVIMWKNPCVQCWLVVVFFALTTLGLAAEKGYKVHGYIYSATSPTSTAAQGVNVVLINKQTGAKVDSATTGWTGGYKFKDVPPGKYVLKVNKFSRDVEVAKKNVRTDFDLSRPDGSYSAGRTFMEGLNKSVAAAAAGKSSGGGPAPDVGPSDPNLVRSMAGEYYSYSGSTERSVTLCANGSFYSSSESSYSGSSSDSLGNQSGAWGTANQKQSSGNWSVQGSPQSGTITLGYRGGKTEKVPYQTTGERGCFRFNGNPFCYRSAGRCQ
jgi:hypothetical protein